MANLHDSPFIFGLHDPGGEQIMAEQGRKGWILLTETVGSDPNDQRGEDYRLWSNAGFGVIVRLNNGYNPAGTIPFAREYENFARRCANFVRGSQGASIWIIGNEMNFQVEWPGAFSIRRQIPGTRDLDADRGADPEEIYGQLRGLAQRFGALHPDLPQSRDLDRGEPITPDTYARCYTLCRNAIHALPGHAQDQVLVGAVAPWNVDTKYRENPSGDRVQYLSDLLKILGPDGCDGITIHTYTHGVDPDLIHDAGKMQSPFSHRHYHFLTYRDFMNGIPANMRHLPVYLTEMDQDEPWEDANRGWVKRAYAEINWWNKQPGHQQIRAAILYRWLAKDKWVIRGRNGVINDLREAMRNDYRWSPPLPAAGLPTVTVTSIDFQRGERIRAETVINLRQTPGVSGKPADDVVAQLPLNSIATLLDGPRTVDGLTWWQVRTTIAGKEVPGWLAQNSTAGAPLIAKAESATLPTNPDTPTAPTGKFAVNQTVFANSYVNLRRTFGYVGKTTDDIIVEVPYGAALVVVSGPRRADDLSWWQVDFVNAERQQQRGWTAAASTDGHELLVAKAPPPPAAVQPPVFDTYHVGDAVCNISLGDVNVRKSPGFRGKPVDDVVAIVASRALLKLVDGPRPVDELYWWQVQWNEMGRTSTGWMAEASPTGIRLLAPAAFRDAIHLAMPFTGVHPVSQLWGANPDFYRQFLYDGVPLRGHNGIDFAMPIGTPIVSSDEGRVLTVGASPSGFGNWVMVTHRWGQSVYAHMNRVTVREKQTVRRGEVLGQSGNSGTSTGPHLHFSIRIAPNFRGDGWGGYCDPLPFMQLDKLIIPAGVRGDEAGEAGLPPSAPPIEVPGRRLP